MTQIDRYFLANTLGPFLFFTLILTCVTWLGQSLRIIDLIINYGQSALILGEFAILILPVAMSIVLPIAALAATIYALNRFLNDSELVVVYAAGQGRLRSIRAIFIFGGVITALLAVVTLYLMPTAARTLKARTAEVRSDLAAALIQEGQFLHPVSGVTVFVRKINAGSEMLGVMVHDARDPANAVTYHARRALIDQTDVAPRLVMFEGSTQTVDPEAKAILLGRFDKATYDLSVLMNDPDERARKPSEYYFYDLIFPGDRATDRRALGKFLAEGHEQLSAPLYGFAMPIVAAAVLLGGAFSRRGYGVRVAMAAVAGAGLRVSGLAIKNLVAGEPMAWPLLYAPPLIGAALGLWSLSRGRLGGGRRPMKQAPA